MNKNKEITRDKISYDRDLLYALIDGMPLCLSMWNCKYEILACNSEVLQLFEAETHEYYIDHFFEFSPEYQPDGRKSTDKAKIEIDEAFAQGRNTFLWTHCNKSGDIIPAEVTFSRIPYEDGFVVVSYTRDMRFQLAQQEQIRKFNTRLKGLLDANSLCISLWDRNYNMLMCNQEVVKLFGLSNQNEYLERFYEFSPPYQPDGRFSKDKAEAKIKEAFQKGRVQFNWMHCKRNGEQIPAEITLVRMSELGDEGEDMIAGYTRDLRPQILAEKAEKIASQRIKAVLDATPLSCFLWSLDEKALDCNQIAVQMFGAESKQDLIHNFMKFIPEFQPDGSLSITKMKEKFEECRRESCCIFEWVYEKRNHEDVPCEVKLVKVLRDAEEDIIVAYSRDLRELRKTLEINDKLSRLANYDLLTGCYSRAYFMEQLERDLMGIKDEDRLALFLFDIDYFKQVNDTYGHDIGDVTLKNVVQRANEVLPEDADIGRFGGDEFLVVIRSREQQKVKMIAQYLVEQTAQMEISSGKNTFHVTISVGVVMWKKEYQGIDSFVKKADSALYEAKKRGRNCAVIV